MLEQGFHQNLFAQAPDEDPRVQDRELGHVVLAHHVDRFPHSGRDVDRDDPGNRPLLRPQDCHERRDGFLQVPLLLQPLLVVRLGEVAFPRVRKQDDQDVLRAQRLRNPARGHHGGPARTPGEDSLLPGKAPSHQIGLLVRDLDDVVNVLEPGRFRDEVLPDPFDLVRVSFYHLLLIEIVLQDRAEGVHADDPNLRVLLLQVAADPADRPAGPHPADEMGDGAVRVSPDLRAGRLVVGPRIGLVGVLVRQDRVRRLTVNPFSDAVVGVRMVRRHGGRRDDHARAEGLQQVDFLAAHLVGHREHGAIPLDRGHHREPEPRVPARRLDDRPTGPQRPLRLGVLDHLLTNPVLDAPARVHHLEFGEDEALDAAHDLRQLDERRIPDRLEDVRVVAHGHRGACKTVNVIRRCAPGSFTLVGDASRPRDPGGKPGRAGGGSRTPRKPICSRSH